MTRPKMHFFGGYNADQAAPPSDHNPESYYNIIQNKYPSGRSGTATLEIALTSDNEWNMAEASLYYITPYKCTGIIEVSAWVRFEPYDPPGYQKGLCFVAYEKDEGKVGVANYIEYAGLPGTIDGTGFCTIFVVMTDNGSVAVWEIPNVGNVKKIDDPEEDLDWADSTWYFTRYIIDMQTRSASVYIYDEDGTTLLGKLEDISITTGTRGDPINGITYMGDASYYDLYSTQLIGFGGGRTGVAYFNGISVSADIDLGTLQMTLGETDFDEQIINKISDTAYGESWNGVTDVAPSKNAAYDKIEALISAIAAKVSDDAYAAGWDGVTDVAPSKNAVYDKIEALISAIAAKVSDAAYSAGWNGVTDVAPSKNAVYDAIEALISAIAAKVSDAAYSAGWNGVTDVAPSKNAVYDEIEAVIDASNALVDDTAFAAGWNGDTTHAPSKNAVYDKISTMPVGCSTGTFTGDGKSIAEGGKAITLNYRPKLVVLHWNGNVDTDCNSCFFKIDAGFDLVWISNGGVANSVLRDNRLQITETGFLVGDDGADADPNKNGTSYKYFAIG